MSDSSTISEKSGTRCTTPHDAAHVVKVGIVGTGLAGLAMAHYLTSASDEVVSYDVHLFDESATVGFDSSSVSAIDSNGVERRIDVPMRSFAGGYYNRVIALYRSLGLEFSEAKFTYSFSHLNNGRPETYFLFGGRRGITRGGKPADMGLIQYIYNMIVVAIFYIYFSIVAAVATPRGDVTCRNNDVLLPEGCDNSGYGTLEKAKVHDKIESLAEFAKRFFIPKWFIDQFVVALFCAMSTCDAPTIRNAPAADVVDYKTRTFKKPHFVLSKNSRSAVLALTSLLPKENMHLGAGVKQMAKTGATWSIYTADDDYHGFTHIVLATAPSRMAALEPALEPILRNVKANLVKVLVHTDERVLSYLNPADVRELNLLSTESGTEATHVLYPGIFQTTSPMSISGESVEDFGGRIAKEKVVSASTFERVVRTNALVHAVDKLQAYQGRNNVWLTASWMWEGMVLLEGCVNSAERVSNGIIERSRPATVPRDLV